MHVCTKVVSKNKYVSVTRLLNMDMIIFIYRPVHHGYLTIICNNYVQLLQHLLLFDTSDKYCLHPAAGNISVHVFLSYKFN